MNPWKMASIREDWFRVVSGALLKAPAEGIRLGDLRQHFVDIKEPFNDRPLADLNDERVWQLDAVLDDTMTLLHKLRLVTGEARVPPSTGFLRLLPEVYWTISARGREVLTHSKWRRVAFFFPHELEAAILRLKSRFAVFFVIASTAGALVKAYDLVASVSAGVALAIALFISMVFIAILRMGQE